MMMVTAMATAAMVAYKVLRGMEMLGSSEGEDVICWEGETSAEVGGGEGEDEGEGVAEVEGVGGVVDPDEYI